MTFHFITCLPRSGSALLRQAPCFYTGTNRALRGLLAKIIICLCRLANSFLEDVRRLPYDRVPEGWS
ncbi:hypothetical protein EQG41_11170 [Billgrantia azerbaijanica]|nr:hypothetical protein EQG41_11170 [Halomonas azerbaijanica]